MSDWNCAAHCAAVSGGSTKERTALDNEGDLGIGRALTVAALSRSTSARPAASWRDEHAMPINRVEGSLCDRVGTFGSAGSAWRP
jgi:hypothetical protein